MSKCCPKGQHCTPEEPCTDVCTSPLCGDPTLLPVYAPVIYDELGVNICQTLTIDDNTFSTLTTAEKAFVQVLDIDFGTTEISPLNGRPNCTEITLQNLAITMLIRLYSCSDQLLGTFTGTYTYLPPTTDPGYDEDTNPSSVTIELFTPYGISYEIAAGPPVTAVPSISYLGFTTENRILTQGLNVTAQPKVLNLSIPDSQITVGLTLIVSNVVYSQYLIPHQGKVHVPKGSLEPEDDSLCLNFVNGDLLELDIKPLELGKPACEERLKNDCGCSGSGCCCKNRGPQNTPGNGT